ncbi:MAG: glycosyl hydrolase [Alistipes indistinctus]
MRDDEYRAGRGYTMINKYVSSAAHLTGKRIVSAEEMTNTYLAFRATLELIKIGSDMSAVSGITHSVWHGFNYSPADAPFPGWVQYGSLLQREQHLVALLQVPERLTRGASRRQFQNADMYTDMIILPPNYDMWGEIGVQTDPFPGTLNVLYTSLIWEAICKNGGAADYTSEIVLNASTVKNGKLCYGPKQYGTLFLPEVTAPPLDAREDSRVRFPGRPRFLHRKIPVKSLGFKDYKKRDAEVQAWIKKPAGLPRPLYPRQKPRTTSSSNGTGS